MSDEQRVLDEVLGAVLPIDEALADATRAHFRARLGAPEQLGRIPWLAERLAATRRRQAPPVAKKHLVVCAADEGGDGPGSAAQVARIAAGTAPVNALARQAAAPVLVVDAGVAAAPGVDLGAAVVELAAAAPHARMARGVALALSLAADGLDVLAVAGIGRSDNPAGPAAAVETLAGLCLAGAAIRVPVLLDGVVALSAARLAKESCPDAHGYFLLAHPVAGADTLGLVPLFDAGITSGDGSAAALALPLFDAAVRLHREVR